MAPDHEDRPSAAFYDHESESPRRRRRAAADWGVGEDIFDRMPSSRFGRVARRPEHREIVIGRDESPARATTDAWDPDSWGEDAPGVRERNDAPRGRGQSARGRERVVESWGADTWAEDVRGERNDVPERAVDSWHEDDEADFAGHMVITQEPRAGTRTQDAPGVSRARVDSWMDDAPAVTPARVDSWMDEAPLVPGESRTIVLGNDEPAAPQSAPAASQERRTVKISGHPDRLPVPRTQRPPRSAVDRIGASPDRIVAWAVALGFLLVLIAVLTTGQ